MSYMMGGESPPANGYTVVTSVRPPTKTPKLTIGSRSLPLSLSPYLSLAIDTIEKTIGSIAPVNLDRDIAEYTKLKESQQKLIDTIAERIEELKTKELEQRKRVLAEADRYLTLAQTNKAQAEQTSKLLSDAYQRIIDYATRLPQRQKELQDKHAELIQKEAEEAAAAATEEAVEEANTGEVMEGGGRGKKVLAKRLSRKVRVLFRKHLKKLTRRR
jgi:Skp family chaperone for outer membrane proteins